DDAAEMVHDFFRTASPEDIESALRVSHTPIGDAIGCGRYEIAKIRPVEDSCDKFPVLDRDHIESLGSPVEEMERPVLPVDDDDPGDGQGEKLLCSGLA